MSVIWQFKNGEKTNINVILEKIDEIIKLSVSKAILYGDIFQRDEIIFIINRLTKHNISVITIAENADIPERKLNKLSENKKASLYIFIDPGEFRQGNCTITDDDLTYLRKYDLYKGIISPQNSGYYVSERSNNISEHMRKNPDAKKSFDELEPMFKI